MKRTLKQLLCLLLALCLLAPLFPEQVEASETAIYNASDYSRFQRSPQDVANRWRKAMAVGPSYKDGSPSSYYTRPASTKAPYDQGELTQDTLDHMYALINCLRWLSGGEPLMEAAAKHDDLQRCALIRNFDFNHSVSDDNKPDDMSQELWDSGKVSNHVLALFSTPEGAILSWFNEGYSMAAQKWGTLGHRYNLMEQQMGRLWFGYSGNVAAGAIKSYGNSTSLPFTAFPFPGPMPTELLYSGRSAWGLELNDSIFTVPNSGDSLAVTVTNTATGEAYTCTKANGMLTYQTWYIQDINFVQPACSSYNYAPGSVYSVVVTGLQEKATGKAAEIRYTVDFFSLDDYPDVTYDITLNAGEGGTAQVTPDHAAPGTEITVLGLPDNGYRVSSVTWTPAGGTPVDITADRKFIMPASDVTVNVRFAEAPMYDLHLTTGPNGTAELNLAKASAGQRILVHATPADTYRIDKITWTPKGGSPVDVTKNQSFLMPESEVTVNVSFKHVNPFADVSDSKYYCDSVLWAFYHDPQITSGIDSTHFGPNNYCTREQIMTFLWKALGAPKPGLTENPFEDVIDGKYYCDAILWAVENDITSGFNPTTFGVGRPCTRAQVVTFLYSAAGKPPVESDVNPFTDVQETDYYYSAVLWAWKNGVTGGTTPTTFSPKQTCTRAQVVTFLCKAVTSPETGLSPKGN